MLIMQQLSSDKPKMRRNKIKTKGWPWLSYQKPQAAAATTNPKVSCRLLPNSGGFLWLFWPDSFDQYSTICYARPPVEAGKKRPTLTGGNWWARAGSLSQSTGNAKFGFGLAFNWSLGQLEIWFSIRGSFGWFLECMINAYVKVMELLAANRELFGN